MLNIATDFNDLSQNFDPTGMSLLVISDKFSAEPTSGSLREKTVAGDLPHKHLNTNKTKVVLGLQQLGLFSFSIKLSIILFIVLLVVWPEKRQKMLTTVFQVLGDTLKCLVSFTAQRCPVSGQKESWKLKPENVFLKMTHNVTDYQNVW